MGFCVYIIFKCGEWEYAERDSGRGDDVDRAKNLQTKVGRKQAKVRVTHQSCTRAKTCATLGLTEIRLSLWIERGFRGEVGRVFWK